MLWYPCKLYPIRSENSCFLLGLVITAARREEGSFQLELQPFRMSTVLSSWSNLVTHLWLTVFTDDHHLWILFWMNHLVVVVVVPQNVRKLWKMSVSVFTEHKLTSSNASFVHDDKQRYSVYCQRRRNQNDCYQLIDSCLQLFLTLPIRTLLLLL